MRMKAGRADGGAFSDSRELGRESLLAQAKSASHGAPPRQWLEDSASINTADRQTLDARDARDNQHQADIIRSHENAMNLIRMAIQSSTSLLAFSTARHPAVVVAANET